MSPNELKSDLVKYFALEIVKTLYKYYFSEHPCQILSLPGTAVWVRTGKYSGIYSESTAELGLKPKKVLGLCSVHYTVLVYFNKKH